jgi:hypothetical protein
VLTVRPKVAELTFQLYGRPLHPELFQVYQSRRVDRGGYQAKIDITGAGHVVTWRAGSTTLTEVAAAAHNPLPKTRRLLFHRLKGEQSDTVQHRGGIAYQVVFSLEIAEPEVFWAYQQDLVQDAKRDGLLYRFGSGGRMAMGALSYVHVETCERTMRVKAFHTFPDDWAIVKSLSQFELPRSNLGT